MEEKQHTTSEGALSSPSSSRTPTGNTSAYAYSCIAQPPPTHAIPFSHPLPHTQHPRLNNRHPPLHPPNHKRALPHPLISRIASLQSSVETLEDEVATLQLENTALKSGIQRLKYDFKPRKARAEDLEGENRILEVDNGRLLAENVASGRRVEMLRVAVRKRAEGE